MKVYKLKNLLPWLIVIALFIVLTPEIFTYAEAQRGYKAVGGEMFFPLLPLLGWVIHKMVRDTLRSIKEVESEDSTND